MKKVPSGISGKTASWSLLPKIPTISTSLSAPFVFKGDPPGSKSATGTVVLGIGDENVDNGSACEVDETTKTPEHNNYKVNVHW